MGRRYIEIAIPELEDNGFYYWPEGASREETLNAFIEAYASLGYRPCVDGELELGVDKVAIFALTTGAPTHVARQLQNGRWTSKLGKLNDIEHVLEHLNGPTYGRVTAILKRPRSG